MDIKTLAYTLYKIDWLRRISHDRIADLVKNFYDDTKELEPDAYTLSDYFEEYGFNGETYVCFDEFIDSEYRDKGYIKTLLNESQYNEYLKDLICL